MGTVIDGAIPVRKTPPASLAVSESGEAEAGPDRDESTTRRAHRQRMKQFLDASKSVA